ncbi:Alpha/Beta hydrolase protein [Sporodiniella umbellata]|nr:Alpha/Beta hydrolase protein [Sporodiniella umbellata]
MSKILNVIEGSTAEDGRRFTETIKKAIQEHKLTLLKHFEQTTSDSAHTKRIQKEKMENERFAKLEKAKSENSLIKALQDSAKSRQTRFSSIIDSIEAKNDTKLKNKRKRKEPAPDLPSEEEFAKLQEKLIYNNSLNKLALVKKVASLMINHALKWSLAVLIASFFFIKTKPLVVLGSLADNPSDFHTTQFYPNGSFLELPEGRMHYWKMGNEDGPRVVLVHGMSAGTPCYKKLSQELVDRGYHVLLYDLWGREFSDAPHTKYNEALFNSQLISLLYKVGWNKASFVGISLGGGVAVSFASFYPEMVEKLILVAPVGYMRPEELPWTYKFAHLPVVKYLLTNLPTVRPFIEFCIKHFSNSVRQPNNPHRQEGSAESVAYVSKMVRHQIVNHPGFLRAFVRTVIDYPFTALKSRYDRVGQFMKPGSVLVIWGDEDKVVPYENLKYVSLSIPHAKITVIKHQRHDILLAAWKTVNTEVRSFLAS